MKKVGRTLAWIGLGVLNGSMTGTIVAILFGWITVGCNENGIEAVNDALPFGALLGSMIGVIGGAVCEARRMRMTPFLLLGVVALGLGCCLLCTHGLADAFHRTHTFPPKEAHDPTANDKAPTPPAKEEDRR